MNSNLVAIITVGIPASGKSTYAKDLEEYGFYEVNLDDCRKEVCGDHTNQEVTALAVEKHTQKILENAVAGKNMVISDTNLDPRFRKQLEDKLSFLNYEVYYVVCNTPFVVCQARNLMRKKPVPFHAMSRMSAMMEEINQ